MFLNSARDNISRLDGDSLAGLIQLQCSTQNIALLKLSDIPGKANSLDAICTTNFAAPWAETIINLIRGVQAESRKQWVFAFEYLARAFQTLFKALPQWAMPVLLVMSVHLRKCAKNADAEMLWKGQKPDKLESVANTLIKMMNTFSKSRPDIMLHVTNQLFKIYFRINQIKLCPALCNTLTRIRIDIESTPKAQQVTYHFFVGRMAMFESKFEEAEKHLKFAFLHCHRAHRKNKRLALQYLVCVRLALGRLPTNRLLKKYDLDPFVEICKSYRIGDVRLFNDALARHQEYFIRNGLFLTLERAKQIVMRNFFKRVASVVNDSRIPLSAFASGLRILGLDEEEWDLDQIECWLCNLISSGKVQGYISHERRFLIVSKSNPFPPLKKASDASGSGGGDSTN